jgi:hypothetical protein
MLDFNLNIDNICELLYHQQILNWKSLIKNTG